MQMDIKHKFFYRTQNLEGRLLAFSQTNAAHPSYTLVATLTLIVKVFQTQLHFVSVKLGGSVGQPKYNLDARHWSERMQEGGPQDSMFCKRTYA